MTRGAALIGRLLLVAALAAAVGGLFEAGQPLGWPPVTSWRAASEWYEAAGPATATASAARLIALVVAGWLLLAASADVLANAAPRSGARFLADLIAPRSLQRIVHGLAGLSLTAGLTTTAPSAGTPHETDDGVATLRFLDDDEGGSGTATLRLAEEPPATPAASAAPAPAAQAPAPQVQSTDETVVVAPGDSLWSLAEEALADARGADEPPASDATVATYWRRVIETNRSALVDPTNPDLIYPGQVISLPSP